MLSSSHTIRRSRDTQASYFLHLRHGTCSSSSNTRAGSVQSIDKHADAILIRHVTILRDGTDLCIFNIYLTHFGCMHDLSTTLLASFEVWLKDERIDLQISMDIPSTRGKTTKTERNANQPISKTKCGSIHHRSACKRQYRGTFTSSRSIRSTAYGGSIIRTPTQDRLTSAYAVIPSDLSTWGGITPLAAPACSALLHVLPPGPMCNRSVSTSPSFRRESGLHLALVMGLTWSMYMVSISSSERPLVSIMKK